MIADTYYHEHDQTTKSNDHWSLFLVVPYPHERLYMYGSFPPSNVLFTDKFHCQWFLYNRFIQLSTRCQAQSNCLRVVAVNWAKQFFKYLFFLTCGSCLVSCLDLYLFKVVFSPYFGEASVPQMIKENKSSLLKAWHCNRATTAPNLFELSPALLFDDLLLMIFQK